MDLSVLLPLERPSPLRPWSCGQALVLGLLEKLSIPGRKMMGPREWKKRVREPKQSCRMDVETALDRTKGKQYQTTNIDSILEYQQYNIGIGCAHPHSLPRLHLERVSWQTQHVSLSQRCWKLDLRILDMPRDLSRGLTLVGAWPFIGIQSGHQKQPTVLE